VTSNILYFIIVISVYSFYEPASLLTQEWQDCLLYSGMCLFAFYLWSKMVFKGFEKKHCCASVPSGRADGSMHNRLVQRCSMAAIGIFALIVYTFDFKYHVISVTGFGSSLLFVNLCGIALFMGLLAIVWMCAFPSYRLTCDAAAHSGAYVQSHVRLNAAIVIPWLLFSLVLDILGLLPERPRAYIEGNPAVSYAFFAALLLATGYFFPWILVRLWNCAPLPAGPVRERIELFCKNAGFEYADIVLWNIFEGRIMTAGVVGLGARVRYLLLSPSLLDILNMDELDAVVGHEVGHVRHRHMIFYICYVLGYTVFAYAFLNVFFALLLSQDLFFDLLLSEDGALRAGFYVLTAAFLGMLIIVYFRLFFGLFSRHFERQSDAFAIKICGGASGIIGALEKLGSADGHSRTAPNWHHYSIQERIDFLKRCESDATVIERHSQKVRRLVGAYAAALALVVGLLYGVHGADVGDVQLGFVQKVIEKRLISDEHNPAMHLLLANIYFEKGQLDRAEKEYLICLDLQPDQPEALNNLAWLYATADSQAFRRPQAALKLALEAVRLDPQPHILDTLAESYAANGLYLEAVQTMRIAIAKNPPNASYYIRQLKRFEELHQDEVRVREGIRDGTHVPILFLRACPNAVRRCFYRVAAPAEEESVYANL